MSTISASTTTTTAYKVTADTTGTLVLQTGSTPTTAMTIDGSQNVGVGVTPSAGSGRPNLEIGYGGTSIVGSQGDLSLSSSAYYAGGWKNGEATYKPANLDISDGVFTFRKGSAAAIGTAITWTTQAVLDASGRFLVGVTSPVGSTFSTFQYDAATYNGLGLNQSASVSGGRFMLFTSAGTQCGVIDRVGTTSAVVYTATSDQRLKEEIVDSPSAIDHINAVKVRSYKWIDSGHQVKYGVIAQEFYEVEPDAVVKGDDGQEIEKTWSVDTSVMVPAMIKAIQEQQALITELTTRISALENK